MELNEIISIAINLALGGFIGVIGFFLKRTMNQIDNCASKKDVAAYDKRLGCCEDKIDDLRDEFVTRREYDLLKESTEKIAKDMDFIKENTVRSSDFVRITADISRKLDELMRR